MLNVLSVRSFRRAAAVIVAAGALSAPVHAQFFKNATGITSPAKTITFSEHFFAGGTMISNQFAADGVTFSPALTYNAQGSSSFPGLSGDNLGNFGGPNGVVGVFSILFSNVQTRAAFGFATNPGSSSFTAKLNGNVVSTASSIATDFADVNAYYGFENMAFDEIEVSVGGFNNSGLIDNVQLGTDVNVVPEPGTFALLGSLLIPGAAVLRRRRSAVKQS